MCYVDDVVIATPTLEDHIKRLDQVFDCMKQARSKTECHLMENLRHDKRRDEKKVNHIGRAPSSGEELERAVGDHASTPGHLRGLLERKGSQLGLKSSASVAQNFTTVESMTNESRWTSHKSPWPISDLNERGWNKHLHQSSRDCYS